MKKINKPDISQMEICDSINDLKYKERVLQISIEYDKNIYNVQDFLTAEEKFLKSNLDFKDHMIKMYSNRLSSSAKTYENSYTYYNQLREQVRTCPYCNFLTRTVSQLDHYLPKSKLPSLAITASNLVPICRDCNRNKGNYFPLNKENMLLHPYYDTISNNILQFLKCRVVENDNIGFVFYIEKIDGWDDETFNRVESHFEILELDELYGTDFQASYSEFESLIKLIFTDEYKENTKKHIENKVESLRINNKRPWLYAGYKSILENNWYMNYFLEKIFTDNK